jgi:putative protease
MSARARLELVCPAGTPAGLRAAINAGADAVYCGFRDETNARNFPGLNFSRVEMADGIAYAHARETKVLIAINTFPRAGNEEPWHKAVADSAALGADAVIIADIGLLGYAAEHFPQLRRHLSVQAAGANADLISFYAREFGVRRVVLPRVLTVEEIIAINAAVECETEVFVFGGLCVMAEGRCSLSSYVTGKSPNLNGVCSPPSHVRYVREGDDLVSSLNGFTIDRSGPLEPEPYPTICKGRFRADDFEGRIFELPASLDASQLIPALAAAGVTALKVEGRQRSKAYVSSVVRSLRDAIDRHAAGLPAMPGVLRHLSEGQATTEGALRKVWR